MFPDFCHKKYSVTLAILLSLLGSAHGQTSADVTLLSEFAARGVALDTHPVLQLRVEHDCIDGWYGGAFASPVALADRRQGQLTAYAGRAQRFTSTLPWDAGVTSTSYLRDSTLNYHEFYAGLAVDRAGARLFYSPACYGDERSLYLDVNTAWPLDDSFSLAAHAGLLHRFGDGRLPDLRLALQYDIGDVSLQPGWQIKGNDYLPGSVRTRVERQRQPQFLSSILFFMRLNLQPDRGYS
ncbi:MAG: TorF family putative porin [Pseudomonadota bacterium]|nr:TorF family putative porin [Pseudomonadota bacterium]